MAKYIAFILNENGDEQDWDRFVHTLEDRILIRRLNAKIKTTGIQHETQRCVEFMKCWIKEKPKSIDKVSFLISFLFSKHQSIPIKNKYRYTNLINVQITNTKRSKSLKTYKLNTWTSKGQLDRVLQKCNRLFFSLFYSGPMIT